MRRESLPEISQLVPFMYFSFVDGRFRAIFPTDVLKAYLINANRDQQTLENAVSPYFMREVFDALKLSKRENILNASVKSVKPCDAEIPFSREFSGQVDSMSMYEYPHHIVTVLDACNPEKVDIRCTCEKKTLNRDIQGVWQEDILERWNLPPPTPDEKYHVISTCPHTSSVDLNLRENSGLRIFGLNDGLDYRRLKEKIRLFPIKPFLFAWIDALIVAPKLSDYVFDYALTWHSSMFRKATEDVNEMRKFYGLEGLGIYNDYRMKNYIHNKFVTEGIPGEKIDEVVNLVKEV